MTLRFEIAGAPQAKGRARAFVIKHGKAAGQIRAYTPEKTRTYEGIVRSIAMDAVAGAPPLAGPLSLRLVLCCPVPGSWAAWKRAEALGGGIRPTTKPDADNVLKGLADAFNGVVWNDDTQVVHLTVMKVYDERPRVEVDVSEVNAQSAQHAVKPAAKVVIYSPFGGPGSTSNELFTDAVGGAGCKATVAVRQP